MHMRILITLIAFSLIAALTGCTTPARVADTTEPTGTPSATASVEPTEAPVVPSSGPITTPPMGSAQRTALMDAARAGLGLKTKFVVHQLYVQGGVAVADIQPESGSPRMFVAWTGGPDNWEFNWNAGFGAPEASAAQLTGALPEVSPGLAGRIDWRLALGPSNAAMMASFQKYVKASVKSFAGAGYGGGFTYTYKVAKDKKGVWWGNSIAQPDQDGYESIGIYGVYKKGKWSGEPADFGQDNDEALFFPADVLSKLRM
ncbi:MAG: hypothetical protein Q7W30_03070 [Coriobacteriia bacterium]|nr:hypothetical protein [Coriobacteriia bacterium]